jgi:anti-sigma factor RsiW
MDLHAYALGEGTAQERAAVEAYLAANADAREELQRIELTLSALEALPQEEIPRRISFVSDPVFAPSWWQRLIPANPVWTFASASILALAIFAHGWFLRPVATTMVVEAPVSSSPSAVTTPAAALPASDVEALVRDAVAASEKRQTAAFRQVLAEVEARHQNELRMMTATFEENSSLLRKQMNRLYVMSANLNVGGQPE